jgi:hypothetical protein
MVSNWTAICSLAAGEDALAVLNKRVNAAAEVADLKISEALSGLIFPDSVFLIDKCPSISGWTLTRVLNVKKSHAGLEFDFILAK